MGTAWVWDERYAWYDTGTWAGLFPPGGWFEPARHLDHGETKRRLASLVRATGLERALDVVAPRPATDEELLRVHTPEYLAYLAAQDELPRGGFADPGIDRTPFGRGDLAIARLAAGGTIKAADAVVSGDSRNAYALVRPPGHHALATTGLGYCVFANIAIAVHHVRTAWGIERVAVVDWDVHHGNGTQAAFWDDAAVLTLSIHQEDYFPPGSGRLEEMGGPGAEGACLNVPLPPGSGSGAYHATFERIVVPALERFRPGLVVVASGYDASVFDPNGRMMLTSEDYRWMTATVIEVAEPLCGGRVVVVQEGGYSEFYMPLCGLAVVEALAGERTDVVDSLAPMVLRASTQALQPHQKDVIEAAAQHVALVPPA